MTLKFTLDKLMLFLWIAHSLINVIPLYINEWFGGVFNMALIWLFMLYFVFVYKTRSHINFSGIKLRSEALFLFVIFVFLFVIDFQFLYNSKSIYSSFGVNFTSTVWNMLSFFPNVVSALFVMTRSSNEEFTAIKKYIIVMSAIVFIVSIIFLIDNPIAAKLTATGHGKYIPFFFDYAIISAFSVIAPFILNYAVKNKHRIVMFSYLALIIVGIFKSSFFIALLSMILGLSLYIVLSIRKKFIRNLLIILIIGSAFAMVGTGLFERIVAGLVDIIKNEEIKKRISQLLLYSETGVTGDTTSRIRLYFDSWKQIVQHPIIGNIIWDSNCFISGHSSILDVWNGCGCIVLGILCFFTNRLIKINKILLENESERATYFASTTALIFTALFNPIFASPIIVVLWMLAPSVFHSCNGGIKYDNC